MFPNFKSIILTLSLLISSVLSIPLLSTTKRQSCTGDLTSPLSGQVINPGSTFKLTLEHYPSTMSEFHVLLTNVMTSSSILLQQGLGPNGNLSPVTFTITIPLGTATGNYLIEIDELLRDGQGHIIDSGCGPNVSIWIPLPPKKRQSSNSVGDLTSPWNGESFDSGSNVKVTLVDYPSTMSEFHVTLTNVMTSSSVTLQQGLGPNGNLSPVTYEINLPTWAHGSFILGIDEFVRDSQGHIVDTGKGPSVPITIV